MQAVEEFSPTIGTANACRAFGVPPSTVYRHRDRRNNPFEPKSRPKQARALCETERQIVLDELRSERFVDVAPAQVWAMLLEENTYHCSIRTMYRILADNAEVRERRNQLRHPAYTKPELLANNPNQVWSWDITKLKGPAKWNYFYLYVILDIFSRYVVGWMVADCESSQLAKRLIKNSCKNQRIAPGQLTLHADRGAAMKSKPVAFLLADLGATKSHSRPHVSNDNPFSEAQFKTLKYRPDFPKRFGCIQHAKAFCRDFFAWYNNEHYHSGLNLFTPASVHYEKSDDIVHVRQQALDTAYAEHPERFVLKPPRVIQPPSEVWINQPAQETGV